MTVREWLWPISTQDLPLQPKKKVRVVHILAEIKTGHLSNTFQIEDYTMISQAWNPHTIVPLHQTKCSWSRAMDRRRSETVTMSVIKHYSTRLWAAWNTCDMDHMTWRITDYKTVTTQIIPQFIDLWHDKDSRLIAQSAFESNRTLMASTR